jgi:putative hydrolases of HD superfamily
MRDSLEKVMEIIHLSEKLKFELRHSWLSNGRQESVAEHTYRMSLMAILLEPYFSQPVNMEKLLKMIIVHDLVEAEAGDIPAFHSNNNTEIKKLKMQREQQAIQRIKDILGTPTGDDIFELWHEFENKETYEAKIANALDKLEVQIQHNEANLDTWLDVEYYMAFQMGKHVEFDKNLEAFKNLIEEEASNKIKEYGKKPEEFKK